ncbi:hypothetical protein [Luteimonas terrae]|uniref:Lipo-like protein n=1 Tax=Luteimonas terrae TaxID=1530191 RepID=A0A4R5U9I3_9GAMM|nr:hypothetical protein [Luteimonas terrae]TDK31008.1 hypothetical protein E2F49_11795 [Luteimonas terrae]
MTPFLDPAALRAGDILLMRGIGPVSELIAWFGDSTYSHAAVMIDDAHFVEAAAPVSRRVALADRLTQGAYYDFIDVLRPTGTDGEPLDDTQRSAIASDALGCLDVPYPLDALLQMAVFATLRNRIPADAGVRWLLRMLVEHLIADDPSHMVCSELVYRACLAADLPPAVVVSARLDLPFPAIDIAELIREWREAQGKTHGALALPAPAATGIASEEDLTEAFARLRAPMPALGMPPVVRPVPRDVMPVDLEASPQLRRLGRLPLQG